MKRRDLQAAHALSKEELKQKIKDLELLRQRVLIERQNPTIQSKTNLRQLSIDLAQLKTILRHKGITLSV